MTGCTLESLALQLSLQYQGNPDLAISGVSSLQSATPGDICFVTHRKYLPLVTESHCAAVIIPDNLVDLIEDKPCLIAADPHYSFVQAINLLHPQPAGAALIHPSAQVADTAILGDGVSIGAGTVVGEGARIGSHCNIGAGCVVDRDASLGTGCRLHHRVVIERSVVIGKHCELHSGVVIGSDGFGLVLHENEWLKVPQLGAVVIGDKVEIGANTTVDRGALDDTIIESGCKLDNQIQVAHNVHIGAGTAIAACVGIAGSARIGRNCRISGAAVVLGHLSVADDVTITAMSLVTKDIRQSGVYSSGTPLLENADWHKNNVRYKSLDKIARRLAEVEKQLEERE